MTTMKLTIRGLIFAMFPQYNKTNPDSDEMAMKTIERLAQLDRERPEVILMPEPENIHDPNAIRAYCQGDPIGYVAHEETTEAHRLFDASHPMVTARIVEVEVERKGNFYVEAELPAGALGQSVSNPNTTDAWKDWKCIVPKLSMPVEWKNCQVLEYQIGHLLSGAEKLNINTLKLYIMKWIDHSLHDFSTDAMQTRTSYIHQLRTLGGTPMESVASRLERQYTAICSAQRMTYRMKWWKELRQSETMERYWDMWRSSRKADNLWLDLYEVDTQLRSMPGGLYAHIGDLSCLFSIMRYRDDVSRTVLWDVYTLLLLRERICRELGIAMKPLPKNAYGIEIEEAEENTDAMATTCMTREGEEELFCPFSESQQKESGIKMHPHVVLALMHSMRSEIDQKVDWLSFYCVLLRRRWVDDNLSAWCRMVESLFGFTLDNHALSRVLKRDGEDYSTWIDTDERILRRKQLAKKFDTRLTLYFERKRAKILESVRA